MSLEGLLSIESPTREQIIAEVEPGFYRELWSLGSQPKARLLRLVSGEIIRATANHLRNDMRDERGIGSLDDFDKTRVSKGLGSVLGVDGGNSGRFKLKLIEYGVFSTDLREYEHTEDICKRVMDKLANSRWASAYFPPNFVNSEEVLESNRRILANSEAFKNYLKEQGINSIDHVEKTHATGGLGSILGFISQGTTQFKRQLIKYGTFSTDLQDYENIEEICKIAIERTAHPPWASAYFSQKSVESEEVLESNRRIFAKSQAFKNYLKEQGIKCLDDIGHTEAKGSLGAILGFKSEGATDFKKKLIEYGVFSTDLRQYKYTEDICKKIINNLGNKGGSISAHFSSEFVESKEVLKSNRRILANSEAFKNYLKEQGIKTLDDVETIHATGSLGSILGFNVTYRVPFKQKLIEYGAFSADLQDYENIEGICKKAVDRLSESGKVKSKPGSAYFSSTFIESKEVLESNRRLLANSESFRDYLKERGITSLDDIAPSQAKSSIGSILGFKQGDYTRFRQKLIEHGVFSTNIQGYENIEQICKKAIDNAPRLRRTSGYFSSIFVESEEVLKSNRRTLLESKVFQDYLEEQNIELDDLNTVRSDKAKTVFRKLLGIDIGSASGLEGVLPVRTNPVRRRILTLWSKSDEAYLRRVYKGYGPSEDDILAYVDQNQRQIEEDLGRTLFACKMKMVNLGLISPQIEFWPDGSGPAEIIYPFPRIHVEAEPRVHLQFSNYSRLISSGLEPEIVPVYAYESVATSEDHRPQFIHATVPVVFKGIEFNHYNPFEQLVLSTIQQYLADPASLSPEGNHLIGKTSDSEVNILALQRNDNVRYTQVFLRTKFSINPQNIDTNAILLENNSEIYFFKHNQTDVTFRSTRRSN